MAAGSEFMRTGDVARNLGTSRQHVVDLCDSGVLPHVRIGTHRRIARSDVKRLLESAGDHLTREEERSLWLHRALLSKLVTHPEAVLETARRNLRRLRDQHTPRGRTRVWLDRWTALVEAGVDAVAPVLVATTAGARELRQNSPFAGVLGPDERTAVLTAFNRHWREEHEEPCGGHTTLLS